MKTDCNIIRDLLPLYADDVCSPESRELVEEHLLECNNCTRELENLRASEIETRLVEEREDVIGKQKKQISRRSAAIGTALSWIFLVPVIICLFVNRLQGGGLSWFFVVLASMGVVASVTVVPIMVPESKLFWTYCAFTAAVILLQAVTCLYAGGDWFLITATATLFGLNLVFLPFAIRAKPLQKYLPRKKALTVLVIDLALFALMMEAIDIHVNGFGMARSSIIIGLAIGLAAFVIVPQLRKRGIIK